MLPFPKRAKQGREEDEEVRIGNEVVGVFC